MIPVDGTMRVLKFFARSESKLKSTKAEHILHIEKVCSFLIVFQALSRTFELYVQRTWYEATQPGGPSFSELNTTIHSASRHPVWFYLHNEIPWVRSK